MTTKEFSDAFDTLLNSYGYQISDVAFDEYEKSLFLTQAQEQVIIELYTGRNDKATPFEGSEELRTYLRGLIKTDTLEESTEDLKGISKYSKFFILPKDVLFITYETATLSDSDVGCKDGESILVVPVTQDEFDAVMNNPFKQPSKRRALRLDNSSNVAEVVTKYNIKDYTIRYLSKPKPIVLANLEGVSIDNENKITECELDSALHKYILTRAVILAVSSRTMQNKK